MTEVVWFAIGLAGGAVPFSVWLGRWWARADVRQVGDGNPGAANAWRVGGWRVGLVVLVLDYPKGALPVAGAHFVAGLSGWPLTLAALAPLVGHAFSPLLNFRGGKGLAVTFGLWSGLTLAEAPLALGLCMTVFYTLISVEAWAVLLSLAGLAVYLVFWEGEPTLWWVWLGNMAVITWTHRRELRQTPRLALKLGKRVR
jgi:glycerol-3-phosphate acyltransferase PlsY